MDQPETVKRRCPECGARLRDDDAVCWLCETKPTGDMPIFQAIEPRAESGISSLTEGLLLLTAIGIGMGLFAAAPGWGTLYTLIMGPALLRTCSVSDRMTYGGEPLTAFRAAVIFAQSLGAVLLVGFSTVLAISIALYAMCATVFGSSLSFRPSTAHDKEVTLRVFAGVTIALVVSISLTWAYLAWLRRNDD